MSEAKAAAPEVDDAVEAESAGPAEGVARGEDHTDGGSAPVNGSAPTNGSSPVNGSAAANGTVLPGDRTVAASASDRSQSAASAASADRVHPDASESTDADSPAQGPAGDESAAGRPTVPVWDPPQPRAPRVPLRERLKLDKLSQRASGLTGKLRPAGAAGAQHNGTGADEAGSAAAEAVLASPYAVTPAAAAAVAAEASTAEATTAETSEAPAVERFTEPAPVSPFAPSPFAPSSYDAGARLDGGPATTPLPPVGGLAAGAAVGGAAPGPLTEPPVPRPKVGSARRTRKARLRLSRLDPWSVMKTSFLFSIAAGIMLVVAVYAVWTVLSTSQLFDSVNELVRAVVSRPGDTTPFRLQEYVNTQKVMGVTSLIAVVDVLIFTALATLGSFLYNLAATMLGGLEVTLAED